MRSAFLLIASLLPGLAMANDLTIRIVSVDAAPAGEIAFTAELSNLATGAAAVPGVRIKPFLVPSGHHSAGRDNLKGAVLAGANYDLDFSQGPVTVQYRAALPLVAQGDYLLGATVNLNQSITESSRSNNVTPDLVPAGTLSGTGPRPIDQTYDLYSDTANMNVSQGTAYHSWRLFWRGGIPSGYSLTAAFFMIDLDQRKAYWGDYEKGVGLVASGNDLDEFGNRVNYDRYSNSPRFLRAPAGKMYVMTWVNSTERFPELDVNNLDLALINPAMVRFANPTDSWFFFGATDPTTQTRVVALASDYARTTSYSIDPATLPAGVQVSPLSGPVGNVTLTVEKGALAAGVHPLSVTVTSNGANHTLPLWISVRTGTAPVLSLGTNLSFRIRKTEYARSGSITLTNPSSDAALVHLASTSPSLTLGQSGTLVVPGRQTVTVPVGADTRLLAPGSGVHRIRLTTGTQPQALDLTATVETLAPVL